MKLYLDNLWISPYTYTVFAALKEKGVPFDLHEATFAQSRTTDPTFAGKSFTDLIPALEDEGLVLSESLAILEYVEEKYPAPKYVSLFPSDRGQRAQARSLLSWYRCGMQRLREERSSETFFYPNEIRAKGPLSAAAFEEVADLKKALLSYLKPGAEFLFGDQWSIADHETAFMLHRLIASREKLEPELERYARRIWQRPSAREFVERNRPPFASYYA